MDEDLKEATRLLFECMDELRLHDNYYEYRTKNSLKHKLAAYLNKHGITKDNRLEILGVLDFAPDPANPERN